METKSEMRRESASSIFFTYSEGKILLASTPLGTGKLADGEVTKESIKLVAEDLRGGWLVHKCGPETTMEITPIGYK
ncbi:hypothetical protein [Brevibacterium oceani]|uniref:hypothetical protein n=1 Tax=Brevibacterium oceani TaxID=358099 RepID=UPI001B33214F|nr:hypothetical protein [Brevibacterium oceani]